MMNGQLLGGGGAGIKSIQQGTVTIVAGGASGTTAITAVDTANSILIHNGASSVGSADTTADKFGSMLALTSSILVTASEVAIGTTNIVVAFTVIEFYPGFIKSIQTGTLTFNINSDTEASATITAVVLAKSVVFHLGHKSAYTVAGAGTPGTMVSRISLLNTTTVYGFSQTGTTLSLANFMVVEFY